MPRSRKSAAQHEAEGTYRADRHAEPALDLPVALDAIAPSPSVPATVRPEWDEVVRRLVGIGILIDADVPLLEQAFVLLGDARRFHDDMEAAYKSLGDVDKMKLTKDFTAADRLRLRQSVQDSITSLNTQHIKATQLFNTIISKFGISPSERAKILHMLPKPKDAAPKKSIKAVLEKGKK